MWTISDYYGNASCLPLIESAGRSSPVHQTYDIEGRAVARPVIDPLRPYTTVGGDILQGLVRGFRQGLCCVHLAGVGQPELVYR